MSLELSPMERKLLDAMEKHTTVKEAAIAAGLNPIYANQYTENIRKKVRAATRFLDDIRNRSKRSRLIDKVLRARR